MLKFRVGIKMNNFRNNVLLIILLSISSAFIYFIQFEIFHQTQETLFYLLQDLAFLPIQVVMVTMILNKFLNSMEKRKKVKKINVIISTFFVESGTTIMLAMSKFNRNDIDFCRSKDIEELSTKKEYYQLKRKIKEFKYDLFADPEKLKDLAVILVSNKSYLLDMLGNSNLLEHDSFTDMLWAIFHVGDELQFRNNYKSLSQEDIDHLSNDLTRAFTAMMLEWINYINYLQNEYPFLHSLAIKKNPFAK